MEEVTAESPIPRASVAGINPEHPWVMDAEGDDLQTSARWVRATALGRDQVRNLRWLEALHPDDLETTVRSVRRSLLSGKPISIEYRIEAENGEWRWMRSTGSPRFGANGEITRWYGSVEDINDLKTADIGLAPIMSSVTDNINP